jgi:hypothetical protein
VLVVLDYASGQSGSIYLGRRALELAKRLGRISCLLDPSSGAARLHKVRRLCMAARRSWWLWPLAVLEAIMLVIYIANEH